MPEGSRSGFDCGLLFKVLRSEGFIHEKTRLDDPSLKLELLFRCMPVPLLPYIEYHSRIQ